MTAGWGHTPALLHNLVATANYRDLDRTMAMRLGNAAAPENLTRDDLDRAAADLGMLPRAFARLVREMAVKIIPAAEAVRREMPQDSAGTTKRTLDEILRRVQRLSDIYDLSIEANAELDIERAPGWM